MNKQDFHNLIRKEQNYFAPFLVDVLMATIGEGGNDTQRGVFADKLRLHFEKQAKHGKKWVCRDDYFQLIK